jgi:GntR family transcriptional regulator
MNAERARLAMRPINKDVPIPYYYQIAQRLREQIEGAPAGSADQIETALPSEAELCATFEVTRGTARHALELLEREGLIYREKGRGSFVRRRRVQVELTRLSSTMEDLIARGWTPSTRVLHIAVVAFTTHAQRRLSLTEGQPLWEIVRLRLADAEPISLQKGYIPCSRTPGLDKFDLTHSLYYILKNDFDIELKSADQIIRARGATADEAALLEIAEYAPVFEVTRTSYDQNNVPVEHLDSVWRGDRYDFQVHLVAG